MPLPPDPPVHRESPFASMRRHHARIRYPDCEAARSFWVDKLDGRVLQSWPYGELTLSHVSSPDRNGFHLEILAGAEAAGQPMRADVEASLIVDGLNRGGEVVNRPFELEVISARLAFLCDPWGNMLELSESIDGVHVHGTSAVHDGDG